MGYLSLHERIYILDDLDEILEPKIFIRELARKIEAFQNPT